MKRLLNLLLTLLIVTAATAATVNRQQAREADAKFMQLKGKQIDATSQQGNKAPAADQPLYVFNAADDGGFVIVSGDDRTDAILGYTEQGSYDEDNLPPALKDWMKQMTIEIEALQQMPAEGRAAEEGQEPEAASQPVSIHPAIEPLIITTWGQSNNVYNTKCPILSGKHCLTGCVATAGAQIMNYHQWPQELTAEVPGYTSSSSANTSKALPPIQFKWNKMKTRYSSNDPDTEAVDAVAELMLYCGYAAEMSYGTGGSSASEVTLLGGMAKYFGYDPNTWRNEWRINYTVAEWDWLVYNELASGRPLIFSGTSSKEGGHAFICDGYDGAGLYHFNWGWNGGYDGFFRLAGTNPYRGDTSNGYGFISNVSCIIGIQPDTGVVPEDPNGPDEWEKPVIEGLVATARNASVEGTTISAYLLNGNSETCNLALGIGELMENGTVKPLDTQYDYFQNSSLESGSYFTRLLTFDVSSYNLSEGKHTLVPISIRKGEDEWKRCLPADLWYEADVDAEGVVTVVQHPIVNLNFNEFGLVADGTPNVEQGVKISITNNGDNYEANLYLYVDGNYCYRSIPLKIAAGNTKEFRLQTMRRVLSEGAHTLTLRKGYKGDVFRETEVELKQASLETTEFTAPEGKFAGTVQPFDVIVESHAGDYRGPLYFHASKSNSNAAYSYIAEAAIPEGGSEKVRFYYNPTSAGDWNIWLTTDASGQKKIGQGIIHIEDAPTGKVQFERVASSYKMLPNGRLDYTLTLKNTSSTTYYRNVWVNLYYNPKVGQSWNYHSEASSGEVVVEPGQEVTLNFTFNGLTKDTEYGFGPEYWLTYSGNTYTRLYQYADSEAFTYKEPEAEPVPGDIDGDGVLDAKDANALVDYYLTGTLPEGVGSEQLDQNEDEQVDITDIVLLINKIITSKKE